MRIELFFIIAIRITSRALDLEMSPIDFEGQHFLGCAKRMKGGFRTSNIGNVLRTEGNGRGGRRRRYDALRIVSKIHGTRIERSSLRRSPLPEEVTAYFYVYLHSYREGKGCESSNQSSEGPSQLSGGSEGPTIKYFKRIIFIFLYYINYS